MTDEPVTAATILVVEDDAATRAFLTENLAADGFLVAAAPGVQRGTELLAATYPDVVLVDVNLPDGTGLDVLREVRAADGLRSGVDPRTPVLVLSGRDGEVERLRAFERGADDFLGKPYSYPELRGSRCSRTGFPTPRTLQLAGDHDFGVDQPGSDRRSGVAERASGACVPFVP